MRLNRGTLILIVGLAAVLVIALLINNQQASAPAAITPTVNINLGPLYAGVADGTAIRTIELRENGTGSFVELTRADATNWSVAGTGEQAGGLPANAQIEATAGQLVDLETTASFESSDLAAYGLDAPQYALVLTTTDGTPYTLYIGDRTPTNPRYYAVLEPGALPASMNMEATAESTAEATSEATPEGTLEVTAEATIEIIDDPFADILPPPGPNRPTNLTLSGNQTIVIIPATVIQTLTGWLSAPPYQPPATATIVPTFPVIPNFVPEVTPEAEATAVSEAATTPESTLEATAEATAGS